MSLPSMAGRVFFFLAVPLVMAAPARATQLPKCNSTDRHFDSAVQPAAPVGPGTTYYVDAKNGNDSNNGKSTSTAFKTIGKALAVKLNPGDTVLIKAGLYRERLVAQNSGKAKSVIMIGALGDGPVVIDASSAVTGWTLYSGQIYKAHLSFTPGNVVVNDTMLFPQFSRGAVAAGQWYYDSSKGDLYVWAPGGGSPSTHDVGVLDTNTYGDGFLFNNVSHVTLYGVTVRFSGGHGVSILGNNNTVEWSRVLYNGNSGITVWSYGSTLSTGTQILKNEIAYNVMENWPRGKYKWGGWGMGLVSNGVSNFLFQGNVSHNNGGEGMGSYSMTGGTYRDNISYDNWSVNIYVDHGVTIDNNFSYCHDPNPADLYNNGDTNPSDDINLKHLRAEGIMTADESWPPKNLDPVSITNNVVVGCRHGYIHWAGAGASAVKNITFEYNTIVAPQNLVNGETTLVGVDIPYAGGGNINSIFENNIVYASNPSMYALYSGDQPTKGNGFVGLTLDHNLWFNLGSTTPIHWGPSYNPQYDYTLPQWQILPGTAHGGSDLEADPLLTNITNIPDVTTKIPFPTSPAENTAVNDGVTYDYNFCPRPMGPGYDRGAYQPNP